MKISTGFVLPGTLTFIRGPAKSGRSTLLRMLACFVSSKIPIPSLACGYFNGETQLSVGNLKLESIVEVVYMMLFSCRIISQFHKVYREVLMNGKCLSWST